MSSYHGWLALTGQECHLPVSLAVDIAGRSYHQIPLCSEHCFVTPSPSHSPLPPSLIIAHHTGPSERSTGPALQRDQPWCHWKSLAFALPVAAFPSLKFCHDVVLHVIPVSTWGCHSRATFFTHLATAALCHSVLFSRALTPVSLETIMFLFNFHFIFDSQKLPIFMESHVMLWHTFHWIMLTLQYLALDQARPGAQKGMGFPFG